MQVTQQRYYTPEEYLELESAADYKSEYIDGKIIHTAGGSTNHNRIAGNLYAALNFAFRQQDYEVFMGDVRLWIPQKRIYTYPDVMVIAGEAEYFNNRTDTITNPQVIVEVLSKSTKGYDREDKFKAYRTIATFAESGGDFAESGGVFRDAESCPVFTDGGTPSAESRGVFRDGVSPSPPELFKTGGKLERVAGGIIPPSLLGKEDSFPPHSTAISHFKRGVPPSGGKRSSTTDGVPPSDRQLFKTAEYLLIDQTRILVEQYSKTGKKRWELREYDEEDQAIALNSGVAESMYENDFVRCQNLCRDAKFRVSTQEFILQISNA